MPPKKKATAKTAESQQPQQKTTTQQQKPIVSTPVVQQQTVQKKLQVPKQKTKVQPKKQSTGQTDNNTGVIPTARPDLTEAEILKMRRQKFRNASAVNEDVDDKVKEERIKKFGIQPKETKQQIEERKKKFSNPGTLILTEDQETLRQRRQKFTSNQIALQAPEVLEERKKKFAKNDSNLLSLDDEIAKNKTKKIKKFKNKDSRRIHKGGRQGKFINKGRKHSADRSDQKSRKQIFGKKKFIKRFKPNNRTHGKSGGS